MARPKKPISWVDVDKLCGLQCTEEEIAQFLEVSVDTLQRACLREQKMSFAEYFATKRGLGKISLRRAQWQLALKGNATLLIWLGKQYLGQKDKTADEGDPVSRQVPPQRTAAEIVELIKTARSEK